MPFLEKLKKIVEVTKNTLTMTIVLFGKHEPHQHDYHAPVYQIVLPNPETAAAFADAMAKNRTATKQDAPDKSPQTETNEEQNQQ